MGGRKPSGLIWITVALQFCWQSGHKLSGPIRVTGNLLPQYAGMPQNPSSRRTGAKVEPFRHRPRFTNDRGIIYLSEHIYQPCVYYCMSQQAPGKSFRKGITMMELFQMFPDNSTAEKWFESRIWKSGRVCPICKGNETRPATHKTQPYRCPKCRRFFSVEERHGHGTIPHLIPALGDRHLPLCHEPQGRKLHEDPPRSWNHPKIRLVHGSPP